MTVRTPRLQRVLATITDPRLRKLVAMNPHIAEYLEKIVPLLGIPRFYDTYELNYDLKKERNVNIVYPVGNNILIHVYTPRGGAASGYRKYVAVEPPKPDQRLLNLIEAKLAEMITERDIAEDPEAKKKLLLEKLQRIVNIVDERVDYGKVPPKSGKIPVYRGDYENLVYYLIRDKIGLGVLEPFIKDPWIEDVTCRGLGFVYLVHKIFGPLETNIEFKTKEELDLFVIRLAERIGKPLSHARPIVDATLPDGSRINIVFGEDVSLHGSNFTIRKFAEVPISVTQLIAWNTMDERIAAYLWILLNSNMSGFICGETASGKTTTLNAIAVFIPPHYKIVSIEDTAEVKLPHPNWVRELTRDTGSRETSITMFDLLRAALRQRPNYIIVGEIRGQEAAIAFQAMQSVTYETPVMVMNAEGRVSVVEIGRLVDGFYDEGVEGVPVDVSYTGLRVLSLSRDGKVVWAPVRYVLRHRASEVYRVKYEEGGVVRVTGSHSVFILDPETLEIRPVFVGRLKKGDLLVSFIASPRLGGAYSQTAPDDPPNDVANSRRAAAIQLLASSAADCARIVWNSRIQGYDSSVKHARNRFVVELRGMRSYGEKLRRLRIPTAPLLKIVRDIAFKLRDAEPSKFLAKLIRGSYVNGLEALRVLLYALQHYECLEEESRVLLSRLKTIIEGDVVFLEVESVEREEYSGYVYDISVPDTELFFGGLIPVALHNTGHPVLSTFHAGSVERLIQRLTGDPINIPKTFMDNLNFALFQTAVWRGGVMVRRVVSVNEIVGYDPRSGAVIVIPVFTWDSVNDRFIFRGRGASHLLEEKIAPMRGISRINMNKIYEELEMRARFLRLLAEKKVFNYLDVWKTVVRAYELGIEEALRRLERGTLLG